jgi:hypothetical protein
MKKGTTGTITWGNGTTSKVKLEDILTYPSSGMPADYLFSYDENETLRPLIHEKFNGLFPLPEGLVSMVFTED